MIFRDICNKGGLSVVALLCLATSGAQAAAVNAPITGEIERLTLNSPGDIWSGGRMVVGGHEVIIPRNLLMDFPANRLTLQQTFAGAPAACVSRGQSGLAKADSCNTSGTGAYASLSANHTRAGDVIAGDIFLQKGTEIETGVVSFISFAEGYFRLNGVPGSATTGVMVRLNDPSGRHTHQQGLGCAGGPNCSPDPRFTVDPDNYTSVFGTGYPVCLPSTVPRPFTDVLDFNNNGNRNEVLVALSTNTGTGDLLCPDTNRVVAAPHAAADSRRFAPIQAGDHLSVQGNFEIIGGVRFFSAWGTKVSRGVTTRNAPGQPDYMFLDEAFVNAPAFDLARARSLFIGHATQDPPDVVIWSLHRDSANQVHEFPLASVVGCDAAGGAGSCANVTGPNSFTIKHDVDFRQVKPTKPDLNPCAALRSDPRFANRNICPAGGSVTEQFTILSPIPHEIQGRTGAKIADLARAGGPILRTLDMHGNEAANGQYLFPFGINLGGVDVPAFIEVGPDRLDTAVSFSGIPWNLDRRLSPGGCDGICEGTPQPLDPFPFEGLDPRTQTTFPPGTISDPNFTGSPLTSVPNRLLSFVDPTTGNFGGNQTVLAWPPVDPGSQGINVTPPLPGGGVFAPPAPRLDGITPTIGTQGAIPVTLTGINLTGGTVNPIPGVAVTINSTGPTQILASFAIAANATPGGRSVTVTTDGGVSNAVTFNVFIIPALTGIAPTQARAGTSTAVTLTGTNLTGITSVNAGPSITVTNVVANANQITATFSSAASAPVGPVSVTVSNASGASNAMTFTITGPIPTITGLSPATGGTGATVPITITGTGLTLGTVNLPAGLSLAGTPVASFSQITATLLIAGNAPPGPQNITATTPGAGNTSNAFIFTVFPLAPTLTSVAPATAAAGTTVTATLTGTGLNGATSVNAGAGVTVSQFTVISGTQINATLVIAANATTQGISVTNANGTTNTVTFGIVPTLTGISPVSNPAGASVAVTLTGTSLTGATSVNAGPGITVQNLVVVNSTQLTANLIVAANATQSVRNLTVTTPGGITNAVTFNVLAPAPVIASLNNAPISKRSTNVGMSVNGTNLGNLPISSLQVLLNGVPVGSAIVNVTGFQPSQTQIRFNWTFLAAAPISNAYTITVTTPSGTSNAFPFTVTN